MSLLYFSWAISALLGFLRTEMLFIKHQLARKCFITEAQLKNLFNRRVNVELFESLTFPFLPLFFSSVTCYSEVLSVSECVSKAFLCFADFFHIFIK